MGLRRRCAAGARRSQHRRHAPPRSDAGQQEWLLLCTRPQDRSLHFGQDDGAHSWHPMAYNPRTGLVYIPTQEIDKRFTPVKNFKTSPIGWNLGVDVAGTPGLKTGFLLAWDPVKQREVWRVNYRGPWNGGVVTTAGNIVAQGNAAGEFGVYRADTGQKLWSMDAQSAMMGGPITYEVDEEQY